MSTTIIVSICAAIAAIIGLKVYFEHKDEKELEKLKQQVEEDRKNTARFSQEEAIAVDQPLVEETKVDVISLPVQEEVKPLDAVVEKVQLKKKRYYPKKKKSTVKKQNKK